MRKLVFLLSICLVVFTSCQKIKQQEKKTLRIAFNTDPYTIDPRKNSDLYSSTFIFMLYDGLTKTLPSGEIVLQLADRYTVSEDGLTYTFYLKKTKWSDGKPLTAHDFVYSWESQLDNKFPSPCKYLLYPIKNAEEVATGQIPTNSLGIRAIDDYTLEVILARPAPYFLSVTSFCNLYPLPKHILEKNPTWEMEGKKLPASGPFCLKEWNKNSEIKVQKNPLYWDAENVGLDEIQISIISDENTVLQMFENNELDWIGTPLSPLPIEAIPKLQKSKKFNYHPVAGTMFLTYNLNSFPFNNLHLRAAFSYALNRVDIVKNISRQDEIIATRALPPALMNRQNKIILEDHDLELAKENLSEALSELEITVQDLEKIHLLYQSPNQKNIAQTLQNQWEKAFGITVKIEGYDNKVLLDKLEKRDFDISIYNWLAQVNDPMNILDRFKFSSNPKNYSRWEDDEFIRLLDQSSIAKTVEERMDLIEKAEERFMLEFPIATIYHFNYSTLCKPYLHDVRICPIGSIQFNRAWIDDKR